MLISAHSGYPRWLDSGADFLEIDVRRDRHGVIVDAHDEPRWWRRYASLDEILERAAGRIGLHLDLKEAGFEVELVGRALGRFPADRIVVTPDLESSAEIVKQHFPQVRVSPLDFVTVDQSRAFGRGEKPLWVWTVHNPARMRQLMDDPRVECIITNRPDLALEIRKARS